MPVRSSGHDWLPLCIAVELLISWAQTMIDGRIKMQRVSAERLTEF